MAERRAGRISICPIAGGVWALYRFRSGGSSPRYGLLWLPVMSFPGFSDLSADCQQWFFGSPLQAVFSRLMGVFFMRFLRLL